MQDNAPLMTALAKLIAVNTPDLVLFVGEALVGNEAVDQLVRCLITELNSRQLQKIASSWLIKTWVLIKILIYSVVYSAVVVDSVTVI